MIHFENDSIENIAIFGIENKTNGGMLRTSDGPAEIDDQTMPFLVAYFTSPFKTEEYFSFHHEADLGLNEVYAYASRIFDSPDDFYEQAVNIAKHLQEKSDHPKIKAGEFYVVYFRECAFNGETVDAIGLFKSENKDTFLDVQQRKGNYEVESRKGVNINKLDKGCLIFNREREEGYAVAVVDSTNKVEAQYWFDEFLKVRQRQDEYYKTQNLMAMCKNYVVKQLPNEFEVSKADQAELLNKSAQYFKENDSFDMNSFTEEVIAQPEVIKSFGAFRESYEQDHDIRIDDEFDISSSAVKKQTRAFKSVIKLDKNFHIYVHGNNQFIKRGFDEATGMHYYQLFFEEEQ